MRSLTLKLALAFLIVGLIGVVLVAVLVSLQTRRQFGEFVANRYQADVLAEAAEYYADAGSWAGFQASLRPRRGQGGQGPGGGFGPSSLAFYDAGGQLVFAGSGYGSTGNAPATLQADAGVLPIEVDGEVVGYIQFAGRPGMSAVGESPEARFLLAVDRAILWSAGAAALLALVLGVILARTISRPVQELTAATQKLAGGELGHQVPVRTSDEIGELANSFNRMSADLAHANQLRRQMTADIAHDLRTPLSVITGYSEALADGKLPGAPETFEAMHIQAQHLNRLIEDLRTLTLADAGHLSLMRRPIGPRDLLEHTALAYHPAAESSGVALVVEGDNLPPILIDPDRLLQVLANLVSNALRHTSAGGRIDLLATRDDGQVLLRVRDTGPGIPPEDLPYVFERFYRGDKARSPEGASGLGLAIARSLVEAHGGRITAENAPGGGAQFTVSLPTNPT